MVAESASAKGLHSLIRGDCREGKKKKKKKRKKKRTTPLCVRLPVGTVPTAFCH